MKQTFSKIALEKFNPDLEYQDQTCGLHLDFSKEVNDEKGQFQYATESKVKLKNFFCHKDLLEKFNTLRSHLALVCEMNEKLKSIGDTEIEQPEILCPKIHCTGITFTGGGESEGVVLIGFKILAGGSRLNLVTPNILIEDYEHASHLIDLIAEIEREAGLANAGKRKRIQGDLFEDFEADGGTDDDFYGDDHGNLVGKQVKAMVAGMKSDSVKATIRSNGREVEI